jgi:hypothetical protein
MLNPMKSLRALPIVLLFATGCSNADGTSGTLALDPGHIGIISEAPQQPQTPVVSLDNGRRWKANPETTEGIANMRALIEKYPESGLAKMQLKDTLEAEFQMIFQKCTMTGEGHEQLHNYLIPLHKMLSALNDLSPDEEITAMHAHLRKYEEYFE